MNMKLVKVGAALVIVVLLTFYAISPWIAVAGLRNAAKNNDVADLEEYVDFPALRESLKGWITASMMKSMQTKDLKDNPFAGLGMLLANSLVGPMVDAMITPSALGAMASGQFKGTAPKGAIIADNNSNDSPSFFATGMHYTSLNRFVFEKENNGKFMQIQFRRSGIFGWKLYGVKLPDLDDLNTK